jgi:hypothetical protein
MHNAKMEKGQSLIEFGFSMIVIIIVIFGIFNIGRLFWVKIVITNSAREGVRFLILHPNDSGSDFLSTQNVVIDEASNSGVFLAAEHIEVFCPDSPPKDECDSDTTAIVKVTLPMEIGILDIFGISPVTLEESAKMMTP